jgi:phosphatidylinositol glycan class T
MALAFGTIFNLLSKRLVTEEEAELVLSETGLKARLEKIKHKLINRLNLLKNKIIPPPKEIEKEIVH